LITLFYKNTRLIFVQNLRTIQPRQKNEVSTFKIKIKYLHFCN